MLPVLAGERGEHLVDGHHQELGVLGGQFCHHRVLVREVLVHRTDRDARLSGDVLNREMFVPAVSQHHPGGVEDRFESRDAALLHGASAQRQRVLGGHLCSI